MKDVESRMKDIFSWIINKKNIIIFISLNIKILFIFFITNYLKINLRNINKNLTIFSCLIIILFIIFYFIKIIKDKI